MSYRATESIHSVPFNLGISHLKSNRYRIGTVSDNLALHSADIEEILIILEPQSLTMCVI